MTALKDIVKAVNILMVGAFPKAQAHINSCPEGFKRPAYLISRPKRKQTPANFFTVKVTVSLNIKYSVEIDEKHKSDTEELIAAQDTILALFEPGYVRVGDRCLGVTASAGSTNLSETTVDLTFDFMDDKPVATDTTPPMKTVKINTKIKKEG